MRVWLLLVLLLAACSGTAPLSQSVSSSPALPVLHVQPEVLELGAVQEGQLAQGSMVVRNNGKTIMQLVEIQSSCGCTAAEPESRTLMPGALTRMSVSVDTAGKIGEINKTIRIADAEGHVNVVRVHLTVEANPHHKGMAENIFQGDCRSCHYDPMLGRHGGADLYRLGCAMCHGSKGQGAFAPSLRGYNDAGALAAFVAVGTGSGHMPGFAREHGGPLDEEQLHELAEWIVTLE